jgi:hypothetical protein
VPQERLAALGEMAHQALAPLADLRRVGRISGQIPGFARIAVEIKELLLAVAGVILIRS